ncbi:MAG: GGDEF domain-containing protein [Alphaproteobacteria bacterium]|nr:GGDEF domain-containing protein [Alphaproteobacteria bacterium]
MSSDLARFMAFSFAGADLLVELDGDRKVAFVLGATSGLVPVGESELPGRPWTELFAPEDHGLVGNLLDSLQPSSRCGPVLVRLALTRDGGKPRDALFSACRLPMRPNAIACTLSHVSLAAAPHAAAKRRDPGTQLLDAAAFSDVAASLVDAARALDKPLELTFLDLPGLDDLNKRLPAEQSRDLVGRIGALLRAASIDGTTAARISPERFGVVHDPKQRAEELVQRIAEATRPATPDGNPLAVSHSTLDIASTDIPPDGTVRAIRYVVDQVTRTGLPEEMPNSLGAVFEDMVASTLERVRDFSRTVRDNQFSLMYQPIASLATGRFHHFEVLTRFKNDESPLDTIHFAEEIGVIEQLDLAVMTRALSALRQPTVDRRVSFAINISGRSIENGVFVKCLLELLDENKALANRLAIEITESARLKDLTATNKVLQDIRRRSFQVCLDDFGAGSASFQYLQALSVDFVKIDGAYVRRLGDSPKDDAMVRGLVRLCDDLNIGTIAEMVETREQAERLRALGVKLAQGWYYGKPTPTPNVPWDFESPTPRAAARG